MDGSRLGGVRETEATSEVAESNAFVESASVESASVESSSAAPNSGGWSGFGSWPAGLGPPPPRPASTEPLVAPTAVVEAPVETPAAVVETPEIEAPIAIDRPPSAPQSMSSHPRDPTMRWQPSASGPRPVAQSGPSWAAAAVAIQPENPAPAHEPSPVEPAGWGRPAWLAVAPAEGDEEPEEELIGRVLGDRYRVEARIGSGGMGVVYRATHVMIGKRVAIKVLRRRFARQTEVALRFAQEARVASSIEHANVVEISDFGTTPGGSPFCVMEHLEGHSLAREIDRSGSLEPGLALDIAIQVARGLAAAHQANVVHRDLKPENVFLIQGESEGGRPVAIAKILDFGLARVGGGNARLTAAGSLIGTPEYMSPEQARGNEVDARSDLYSLGVMLFELLSGQLPLHADTLAATLTKHLYQAPPKLRDVDARLAGLPAIEAVLTGLLAKSRDDRPIDAQTVVRLLQSAASKDLGVPVPDPRQGALESWSPAGADEQTSRQRRSTIMIGSGAITSAHTAVRVGDGPATGDFDARDVDDQDHGKRPSVIIRDGAPARVRPARFVGQTRSDLVGPMAVGPATTNAPARSTGVAGRTRTPTPEPEPSEDVRRRKRRRARRKHLPIVLLAAGAAVFAALVTIGFVQWWQRHDAKPPSSTTKDARK